MVKSMENGISTKLILLIGHNIQNNNFIYPTSLLIIYKTVIQANKLRIFCLRSILVALKSRLKSTPSPSNINN